MSDAHAAHALAVLAGVYADLADQADQAFWAKPRSPIHQPGHKLMLSA